MSERASTIEAPSNRAEHLGGLAQELDRQVMNSGLAEMVGLFTDEELSYDPAERLAQLERIVTEDDWGNYRQGNEREEIREVVEPKPKDPMEDPESDIGKKVFAAGRKAEMVDSVYLAPGAYDLLIVPGGANFSAKERFAWGNRQPASFRARVGLASTRSLSTGEKAKTAGIAPGVSTEYDQTRGLFAAVLGQDGSESTVPHTTYDATTETVDVTTYETPKGVVYIICAPAPATMAGRESRGEARANTAQSFQVLRALPDMAQFLRPGSKVAITSGSLFKFQYIDALTHLALPTGVTVERTAFSHEEVFNHGNGDVHGERSPKQLVQEARSLVKSLFRFRNALQKATEEMYGQDLQVAELEGALIGQRWSLDKLYANPDLRGPAYDDLIARYDANKLELERLYALRQWPGGAEPAEEPDSSETVEDVREGQEASTGLRGRVAKKLAGVFAALRRAF